MQTVLQVKNLTMKYQKTIALENVNIVKSLACSEGYAGFRVVSNDSSNACFSLDELISDLENCRRKRL